jgi:hypothetical protein
MLAADAPVDLPGQSLIRSSVDAGDLGYFVINCFEIAARGPSTPRRFCANISALLHRSGMRHVNIKAKFIFSLFSGHQFVSGK